MKLLFKLVLGAIDIALIAVLTIVFVRAFDARSKEPLEPWHGTLASEVHARDLGPTATLADYVRMEDALFAEMERKAILHEPANVKTHFNRYAAEGVVNPLRFAKNWNRTYEMIPDGEIRGGVLLMHGLTDSPYSVRAVAEVYAREGVYALALRMPGHGTIPGALTVAHWE